ncbi:MAG: fused MFS/spermidine synthase [Verrucomicrobia bacterium]|nr:fused MFS/spermidine synthase [Verrucomicrobiota bacterium]
MLAYVLTIFTGAFLLFQVQPLMGKYILPWFGGGPGVWTTCMLFFQVVLLAGYAYAYGSARWLKPRGQAFLHLALLVAAVALLPITPGDSWKPHGEENPTLQILKLLAVSLGFPYFVLSATGPLLQHWFSLANPGKSPYRLYALSNAGSLLALVSYPFFFETHCSRKTQAVLWAWGLGVYAVCCGYCAVRLARGSSTAPAGMGSFLLAGDPPCRAALPSSRIPFLRRLLWLLLPASASVLLLATTNKICQDVAVIPFLWILPLALYLLSFIICFDQPQWYARLPFTFALIAALAAICWALFEGIDASIYKQVGLYSGGLFGVLYRLRPEPRQLTAFYLMIAAGGALGGLFVALLAPRIFTDYHELHWGLLLCALLFLVVSTREEDLAVGDTGNGGPKSCPVTNRNHWRWLACTLPLAAFGGRDWCLAHLAGASKVSPKAGLLGLRIGMWALVVLLAASWVARGKFRTFQYWRLLACGWLGLGVIALGITLWMHTGASKSDLVYTSRNFYGVLTVYEYRRQEPSDHYFLLKHGRITHGLQFVEPEESKRTTTYYGEDSGVGLAIQALPAGHRRLGLVGLGTGTLAAYGQAGDYLRIYEINPEVKHLATSRFSYVTQCPARVEIVLGDARLSMEREPPQQFDLLALDAFSSDAIPLHLLTAEAFAVYQRHLKPNGILAVHISNHYLDLEPVVANLAKHFHYEMALHDYVETDDEWWLYASTWILLARNHDILSHLPTHGVSSAGQTKRKGVPLWTDDFSSMFQILK